ncbi:MAG: leucine--tRNA ligase [Thermoplasmata archaeon]|nr:MAG: leucine--tRNA ligase [Thermoplasmata archaeon]
MNDQKVPELNSNEIENKWMKKWSDVDLFKSEQKPTQKKFFIHFAYPGVSGYLHVGHMRGFTYADIISRYKLMTGHNVLYPAGFHASGLPAIGLAKHVARKDPETLEYLRSNGCPEEVIQKLHDPREVVNYFSKIYMNEYWKKFGFIIDFSRVMDTISTGYNKFIQWQFKKLNEKDLLVQKPHFAPFCPSCGPVAVDPSETDVAEGGSAQALEFAVLKFFLKDGSILPAATLRPETIFGVTNMWLHPEVNYKKIELDDGSIWVISPEAAVKLEHQRDNVKEIGEVKGSELIGQTCRVPYTNEEVLILPGDFVDPTIATGVVMSVPAHAPYDWAALVDIQKEAVELEKNYGIPQSDVKAIKAISLITTGKETTDNPAGEICDELGVTSQMDTEKLEEATQIIYKREFHSGVLTSICGEYTGLKISEVKTTLQQDLIDMGLADTFQEFSEHVVCRCGQDVIIKRIPDQWFIRYSDKELTETSKTHAQTMNVFPKSYYRDLPAVLDWFTDRACIRQGSWLGTEFPFKKDWIIEPISDSTIYPAYYVISKFINRDDLKGEDLSDELLDFVLKGKDNNGGNFGPVSRELAEQIKSDFDYWYPVDINLGGKEHKTVHFPVYIMNHVAVMPQDKWPRGIFVNWWVTQTHGGKISKSKGGAEPIPDAAQKYSVDAMRLYYTHVASADLDFEWDVSAVRHYKSRLNRIWEMIHKLRKIESESEDNINDWLLSKLANHIRSINEIMENFDLRGAANEIFFGIYSDIQWYLRRGGESKKTIEKFLDHWIRLMAPFTPYIAEELWELQGNEQFVTVQQLPQFDEKYNKPEAELAEDYLKSNIDDIKEILKVTNIEPKKIVIYTAPEWKYSVLDKVITSFEGEEQFKVDNVIKSLMADPELRKRGKDVVNYCQKLGKDLQKMTEQDRSKLKMDFNEFEFLNSCLKFLKNEYSCEVEIVKADATDIYDPQGKSRAAVPSRPAIYVE